ncbi:hypothetical protein LINPERHAP1_LOCUS31822, partial [Linum perenne]
FFSYPIRENLRREELHPWKIHLPSYEDPSPTCVLRLWLQRIWTVYSADSPFFKLYELKRALKKLNANEYC